MPIRMPRGDSGIATIKVVVPNVTLRVLDRAIQAHGGAGVSQDTFLAGANVRTLRLADGPDGSADGGSGQNGTGEMAMTETYEKRKRC
jgi:hypothetical protein